MASDDEQQAVVIGGNLSDGFVAVGPFDSWDAAADYSEHMIAETWVMSLVAPEQT